MQKLCTLRMAVRSCARRRATVLGIGKRSSDAPLKETSESTSCNFTSLTPSLEPT